MVASEKIIKIKLAIPNIGIMEMGETILLMTGVPKGWLIAFDCCPCISAWDTDNHHFNPNPIFVNKTNWLPSDKHFGTVTSKVWHR